MQETADNLYLLSRKNQLDLSEQISTKGGEGK